MVVYHCIYYHKPKAHPVYTEVQMVHRWMYIHCIYYVQGLQALYSVLIPCLILLCCSTKWITHSLLRQQEGLTRSPLSTTGCYSTCVTTGIAPCQCLVLTGLVQSMAKSMQTVHCTLIQGIVAFTTLCPLMSKVLQRQPMTDWRLCWGCISTALLSACFNAS